MFINLSYILLVTYAIFSCLKKDTFTVRSIANHCCNYLGESYPEHVVQLGQLHYSLCLGHHRSTYKCSISLEVTDESPYFLGAHARMGHVHYHQYNRRDHCYKHSCVSYVGS